ncbi:Hypothetical predicted protein [Mytilus galloprovincialis]|uniref:Integrase catalytic domain-containing protein n=1 Tax=Mytilus galloprovincialis TaxID=29158 RepID=A0A8B6EH64_MYTGA|nr:Hypothetical predicted protein [Mytilus galloprovincialis]
MPPSPTLHGAPDSPDKTIQNNNMGLLEGITTVMRGKEKWKVWFNRFEAVAHLFSWSKKEKLAELLPRLQGTAGDFVYDQLSSKVTQSYRRLVKELENRFGEIDTTKIYISRFNGRRQHNDESVQNFAAELKMLYDKGLLDENARIHVELNKEPSSIEEAVYFTVHYQETCRYPNEDFNFSKGFNQGNRKPIRQIQQQDSVQRQFDSRPQKDKRCYNCDQPRPRNDNFGPDTRSNPNAPNQNGNNRPPSFNQNVPAPFQPRPRNDNFGPDTCLNLNALILRMVQDPLNERRSILCAEEETHDEHENGQNIYFVDVNDPKTQPEMAHIEVLDHIPSIKIEKCTAETQPKMAHIEVLDHTPSTISHDFVEEKQFILVELGPPIELDNTAEIVNTAEPSIEIKEEIILPRDLEDIDIFEIFEDSEMQGLFRTEEPILKPVFKIEKKSRQDGIYIDGMINHVPTIFTVDTGAARTVISEELYFRIPEEVRPPLVQSHSLIGADGNPLRELGTADFGVRLGNFSFNMELVVAHIADSVLLGLDILVMGKKGPAEIRLADQVLLWNEQKYPFKFIGEFSKVRKVVAADSTVVPGYSELILETYIEKTDLDGWLSHQEFLIEPSDDFMEQSSLIISTCLVDLARHVTGTVRLMNPLMNEVTIHQNTVIGTAHLNEFQIIPLMNIEDTSENKTSRYSSVRRLPLYQPENTPLESKIPEVEGSVPRMRPEPKPNFGTSYGEPDEAPNIPPHLLEVFEKAQSGRTKDEIVEIASLLHDFEDIFSKNEDDIGLTHLIEHSIDTGTAKPVKQPPRRVPLAFADKEREIVQQMERQGIIRKSTSPWGSPLCLVLKKSSTNTIKFYQSNGSVQHLQLLTPSRFISEVLTLAHDSPLSGHFGRKKTLARIRLEFYWYEMKDDVAIHLLKCDQCAQSKFPNKKPRAPMGSISVGAPLDRISIDIVGPLPRTVRNNKYFLTATDHFTKWTEVYPIPDQTAETCAQKILDEFIGRFGCPESLHSDQGGSFESEIFQQLCQMLQVRKTRTSARNPKGNGQCERVHRTILQMLRAYLKGDQSDWDKHLGCLMAAYRSSENDSTGLTPNMLMLGREVKTPLNLIFGYNQPEEISVSFGDYVSKLRHRMRLAHEICRRFMLKTAKRRKDHYDVRLSLNSYKTGDPVWLLNEIRKEGVCQKLKPVYVGPCIILKKMNQSAPKTFEGTSPLD